MKKLFYLSLLVFSFVIIGCDSGSGSDPDNPGILSWTSIPANGTTISTATGSLTITFSETMNGNINIAYNSNLNSYADGAAWSSDNKTLTLTMGSYLEPNREYSYTLNPTGTTQTMGTLDGELVPENTTITFTTGSN